ncbi:MAG: lysylphosphatidylglycerol synthase transmembrane domain-containing protein [Planctomycetota bacterium]
MTGAVLRRLLLTGGIAGLLLVLLMAGGGVSPADVLRTVRRLPPALYFLALGLHLLVYALRALRFWILVPRPHRPPYRRMAVIAAAHNMLSYVLPAKTGEASLVVFLRLQCRVPTAVGLASLLVARFLDGAALCFALALACGWLRGSGRYASLHWLGTAGALLAAIALLFLAASLRGDLLVRMIESLLRLIRLYRWRVGEKVLTRTNSLALSLRSSGRSGRLSLAAAASAPIWLGVFGFFTILGRAMGLPPQAGFAEVTFGGSLAGMCNLLPINGVAGVGTQELGWVSGFSQFLGVDYDVALSAGIGVHLVQLFNIVVLGVLAHLVMGVTPRVAIRGDEDS